MIALDVAGQEPQKRDAADPLQDTDVEQPVRRVGERREVHAARELGSVAGGEQQGRRVEGFALLRFDAHRHGVQVQQGLLGQQAQLELQE